MEWVDELDEDIYCLLRTAMDEVGKMQNEEIKAKDGKQVSRHGRKRVETTVKRF